MGADTKLILKQGINRLALIKYLEKEYNNSCLESDIIEGKIGTRSYSVFFKDKEDDSRRLWVLSFDYEVKDDDYPVKIQKGKSCMIFMGFSESSVKILEGIANNFGGGYLQENDCDDDRKEWHFVKGDNNRFTTDLEDAVYSFVENAKDRGELESVALSKFLLSHLEELKYLK